MKSALLTQNKAITNVLWIIQMDVGTIVWISITKFFGREKNVKIPISLF